MERVESTTSSLPPPNYLVQRALSLTATSSEALSIESLDANEQFSLTRYITVYIYIYIIYIYVTRFAKTRHNGTL